MRSAIIINYGIGNVGSLGSVLDALGYAHSVSDDPEIIRTCPLLVLPGVGSAKTALKQLSGRKLIEPLRERHKAGKAIIGICLGGQLFFDYLEEADAKGLGFIKGEVRAIEGSPRFNTGWCHLDWKRLDRLGIGTGIFRPDTFFFNHQYRFPFAKGIKIVTIRENPLIPAMYMHGNLCGIQFHPEKSQKQGRTLLRNVLQKYYGL